MGDQPKKNEFYDLGQVAHGHFGDGKIAQPPYCAWPKCYTTQEILE